MQSDTPEIRAVINGRPLADPVPFNNDDLVAIALAGYQFIEQGQLDRARNAFDAMTKLSPKLSAGYAGLGAVSLKEANYGQALDELSTATRLNHGDATILTNLGEAMLRLGQYEQAAVPLRAAVELDPNKQHPAANRARAMLAGIEEADAAAKLVASMTGVEAGAAQEKN